MGSFSSINESILSVKEVLSNTKKKTFELLSIGVRFKVHIQRGRKP